MKRYLTYCSCNGGQLRYVPACWIAIYLLKQLCGSVPGNPELIAKWLEVRMAKNKPAEGKSLEELKTEVVDSLVAPSEAVPQVALLVFQRDNGDDRGNVTLQVTGEKKKDGAAEYVPGDGGLVMRAGTMRAHLKDCARIISAQYMKREDGVRAFSTMVINGVYLDEQQYWLPLFKDGRRVMEADGNRDKPIHVKGPRGENINALKNFEYVNNAELRFTLKVLGESVSEEQLRVLFQYGGVHGYAGERGDGEGRYTFTLTRKE